MVPKHIGFITRIMSLILLFLLAVKVECIAQDSTRLSAREQRAAKLMKLSNTGYAPISNEMRQYNQKLLAILNNKSLSNDERRKAISNLHTEHRLFMQKNTSETQRNQLTGLDSNNQLAKGSPRVRKVQELKERMRKKGVKITSQNKTIGYEKQ